MHHMNAGTHPCNQCPKRCMQWGRARRAGAVYAGSLHGLGARSGAAGWFRRAAPEPSSSWWVRGPPRPPCGSPAGRQLRTI